jgi:LysR family transcriptional regulator, hydrogen peroxide-inducible genes activator
VSLAALRYAAAVAEHGSFSGAARACDVAQPTISNAVADLEDALGARLFERSTRRLALTPSGQKLLPLVTGALAAVCDLETEAKRLVAPTHKLVRVAFSQLLGAQRLARLFGPFQTQHPGVEIIYKECTQGDMEARLDGGAIDFACGIRLGATKTRGRRVLYREPLRWVPPNATPSPPQRREISLREVARVPLLLTAGICGLRQATREMFARANIATKPYAGEALSYAALEEWAELGIGGALLPASHIRRAPSIALVEDGEPVELAYEAVWRKDLVVARHVVDFVSYLRDVVPKLVKGNATT